MKPIRTILGSAIFMLVALPLEASDYNQRPHLDPDTTARVNRFVAESWREKSHRPWSRTHIRWGTRCGDQIIGDLPDDEDTGEVIIVKRSIFNINRDCTR